MDLAHEYLKINGQSGYLHERDTSNNESILLSYAKEGCYPEYYWCHPSDVEQILKYWKVTGDFSYREFNSETGDFVTRTTPADIVRVIEPGRWGR
jgi:hypothetical protein